MSPVYRYRCEEGHEFELRAGYEDDIVTCPYIGLISCGHSCGAPAKRQAVYREQAVIFSGPGWTRSVVPPPEPLPPSSHGESTAVHYELLDEFAEAHYKYETEVKPEVEGG